jgi:drug/metabolite transporter (DMT)-like permease
VRTPTPLAWPALFLGAAGIGFAPIFVRWSEAGPGATAFWRIALALPAMWAWMAIDQRRPEPPPKPSTRRDHVLLALAGLFFAGDLALWHWSIKFTSVANSTLFANFAPIFVTLGARIIFGDRVRPLFIVAVALAITGAALLVRASLELSARHLLGDALGIGAAVFYAAYQLSIHRLRKRFATGTIMFWSGLACAPALLAAAWAAGETLAAATARGWCVLVALALVSQMGGQSLIAYAFAHLPAALASLGLLVQPACAALLAWALLREPLGWQQALGGAIILAAIALANRMDR